MENSMNNQNQKNKIYKIFISYSSKDRELRAFFEAELKEYLHSSAYQFEKLWVDTEISIGEDWNKSIQDALKSSDIGILLVSQKLLSSQYSIDEEFMRMKDLQTEKNYLIIPVLLRETNFGSKPELASMQFFKTYQSEYDITHPLKKNQLMPFDELYAQNDERLFNRYFNKFVKELDKAISKLQINYIQEQQMPETFHTEQTSINQTNNKDNSELLKILLEKKAFLEKELITTYDAEKKFALQEQIKELESKIGKNKSI